MTQPVRVDVPGLRRLGDEIAGHGAGLRRDVAAAEGRLTPPAGSGMDGWTTLDATARASAGWRAYLDGLGHRIEATGTLLVGSAENYQESERRSVQRVARVRRMTAPGASGAAGPGNRLGAVG
ncbi:hypothetical protein O7626_06965 [Micromonospora sp. WMMD1102]|uniref:hypothetical protein n=1 Tax=Micromonospora sp. WMMD1102 TaxID=3016105 RepID=UPI0024156786|nr:hypothetical protein [Micromonospora sp. WMMD1102]MDG4785673.1 hypothetical protein [Micromonospora sp. WMMD1102]